MKVVSIIMLKLNRSLFKVLNKQLNRCMSFSSTECDPKSPSLRQRLFLNYQQKYKNYEHIFYSSHLELQDDSMELFCNKNNENLHRQSRRNEICYRSTSDIPINWMQDFEYFNESDVIQDKGLKEYNILGTPDPNIPKSNVACSGCGAILHCNHHASPGFLPTEIFKGRTDNELKTMVCVRCHFLKNYNIALDVEVSPETYVDTIRRIKDQYALAIVVVDLLDFPCSMWPGMPELLGHKRPIFVVGNKVDLLPRDSMSYLEHIKNCLKGEVIKSGFNELNVKNISLVSAKTGYGVEELITQLHRIWAYKGDVYLLGCTNVGKSSLFNALLNSDYSRPETVGLIPKSTICPWPGTTLQMLKFPIYRPSDIRVFERFKRLKRESSNKAENEKLRMQQAKKFGKIYNAVPEGKIGRTFLRNDNDVDDIFAMSKGTQPITTFNERGKDYREARWVYDTPGVMHPEQITNFLTPKEIIALHPKQMISPRAYRISPGMSLFLAGLSRLDFVKSDSSDVNWVQIFVFASFDLPTMIVETKHANDVYQQYVNTPLMKVPRLESKRNINWPGLECHPNDISIKGYVLKPKYKEPNCSGDIILSSCGWVGLNISVGVKCTFKAWTPNARGIYLRIPSIVPYAHRIIGKKIRNSLAYNTSKPFVFKK